MISTYSEILSRTSSEKTPLFHAKRIENLQSNSTESHTQSIQSKHISNLHQNLKRIGRKEIRESNRQGWNWTSRHRSWPLQGGV